MPDWAPTWLWIVLLVAAGVALGVIVCTAVLPRVGEAVRETPSPDLPKELAPGWTIACTRCGRSRPLAGVGGVRLFANRSAHKATLAWCRGCRRLRIARIAHRSGESVD